MVARISVRSRLAIVPSVGVRLVHVYGLLMEIEPVPHPCSPDAMQHNSHVLTVLVLGKCNLNFFKLKRLNQIELEFGIIFTKAKFLSDY